MPEKPDTKALVFNSGLLKSDRVVLASAVLFLKAAYTRILSLRRGIFCRCAKREPKSFIFITLFPSHLGHRPGIESAQKQSEAGAILTNVVLRLTFLRMLFPA